MAGCTYKNCLFIAEGTGTLPCYDYNMGNNAWYAKFDNCTFLSDFTIDSTGSVLNPYNRFNTNCAFMNDLIQDYSIDCIVLNDSSEINANNFKLLNNNNSLYGVYSGEYAWKPEYYFLEYFTKPRVVYSNKINKLFYLLRNSGDYTGTYNIKFLLNNEVIEESDNISSMTKYIKKIVPSSLKTYSIRITDSEGNEDEVIFDYVREEEYRLKSSRSFIKTELGYKNKNLLQKNNIKRIV